MLLSTTTDSSTTCAPAFDKSLRTFNTPVNVRPFKSSVSINTNGPWQIANVGTSFLVKYLANVPYRPSASPRKWSGEKPPELIMHHNLLV